jgi:hypothetical protein
MHFFELGSKRLYCLGKFIKVCGLADAWYEDVDDPLSIVASLKKETHGTHLFTFFQRPPHTEPRFHYYMEPYPVSVIKITSYEDWWTNSIQKKTRQAVKKAHKEGVEIRIENYNDEFIRGISQIYNETPIRMGKRFPHYNDSFEKVKEENGTFVDRSIFLGAYYNNELIGFTKIVFEKEFADILQHLSKIAYRDLNPSNALMAKAIEVCAERHAGYLAYGDWDSGGLGDFKRHSGFSKMVVPKYYIPINWVGAVALKFKLHKGLSYRLPKKVILFLKKTRLKWYQLLLK